jgi:hypothetical protein
MAIANREAAAGALHKARPGKLIFGAGSGFSIRALAKLRVEIDRA